MKTALLILWTITLLIFSAGKGNAHPMGNFSINHYSGLEVAEDGIRIRYILDFAEIPTFQERQIMDQNKDGKISEDEKTIYLSKKIPEIANKLVLKVGSKRQGLQILSQSLSFPPGAGDLPTMRLDLVYKSKTKVMPLDENTTLSYTDLNYPRRAGWKEMSAQASPGLSLIGSTLPNTGSELLNYPDMEISSPPQVLETAFSFQMGSEPEIPVTQNTDTQSASEINRGDAFTALMRDTAPVGQNLLWVLMAAFALGAAHALSPGHGKTLVAAYLVGSQGTFWHALILGITVTFSHTIGVFALGFVTLYLSDYILPEQLYPWLSRFSGLTILIIGLMIFKQRWATFKNSSSAHTHQDAHSHAHAHTHHNAGHHPEKKGTMKRILGLGISGGIIPCPSALVVLLSAIAFHQVGFGLLLIVAFSAGLAATLVLVGLSVVYLGGVFKGSNRFSPLMRFLPPASAAGMAMLGGLIAMGITG